MQDFEAEVLIDNINVRKEGAEKETVVLDVGVEMVVDADTVDDLMCGEINDGECTRCFWLANDQGDPRFKNMEHIKFKRSFSNVNVEMMTMIFNDCKLSKFSFNALPDLKAGLHFSIAIREPQAMAIDRLASMMMNRMPAKFWMPQGDMITQIENEKKHATRVAVASLTGRIKPEKTPEPETKENIKLAKDFMLETGKVSISAIQRQLKIGYNRAARIIETLEEEGFITPMDKEGNRSLAGKH